MAPRQGQLGILRSEGVSGVPLVCLESPLLTSRPPAAAPPVSQVWTQPLLSPATRAQTHVSDKPEAPLEGGGGPPAGSRVAASIWTRGPRGCQGREPLSQLRCCRALLAFEESGTSAGRMFGAMRETHSNQTQWGDAVTARLQGLALGLLVPCLCPRLQPQISHRAREA